MAFGVIIATATTALPSGYSHTDSPFLTHATFRSPQFVMTPRFVKVSAQLDF